MASKHSVELAMLVEKARAHLPPDDHDKPARLADEIMAAFRPQFRRMPSEFFCWCREALYQRLMVRFKKQGTEELPRQAILDLWTDPIAREHVVRFGDTGFYLQE